MDIALVFLFLGGIVLTLGDIVMKKWVISGQTYAYFLGIFIYLIGMNFLAQSFKFKNIAVASVLLVVFNVITLTLVSWFFFKEKLSPLELLGILFGVASVVILEMSGR